MQAPWSPRHAAPTLPSTPPPSTLIFHHDSSEETACLLKNDDGTCKKGYSYTQQASPTRDEYFASQHMGFGTQYPGNGGYIIDLPSINATLRGEVIAQAFNPSVSAQHSPPLIPHPASSPSASTSEERLADVGVLIQAVADIGKVDVPFRLWVW